MAQTYKFGNGTWATKKGSTLAYSDTNNAFKPLPFSFERNSIATRVNKEGLIEVVGNDIPRIDFSDDVNGALLLEPTRSNLITYSEDFNDASWIKSDSSVTSGFLSLNGTLNADKLIPNTDNTPNHYIRKTVSISNLTDYSYSFFAKKGEYNFVSTYVSALGGVYSWDLENGVVLFGINAFIENYGNGWYRCGLNATSSSTSLSCRIYASKYSDRNISFQGDGTSGVYIFGAQLEQGSYATSYIPTNGSIIQRAAETCNGSGNSEVFNDSQGVLFANMAANSYGGGYKLISLTDSTSGNSFVSIGMMSNTTQSYKQIRFGGINLFTNFNDPIDQTSFNKIAIKYKSGDSSFYVNGFEIDSSSVTYTPSANMSEFKFSYFQDGDDFYGKTKEIGYYDTALTDAELETLTSYRSLNEMVTELNLNAL